MSHVTGTVQPVSPPITLGPDTGNPPDAQGIWAIDFAHQQAPTGTKLLILHFTNADLPPGNRLEVDLGYDTNVFTAADGPDFWTRPVNHFAFPAGKVPIRCIAGGVAKGSVRLATYGRGERHPGEQDPKSLSNCDPFLHETSYEEPKYDPTWVLPSASDLGERPRHRPNGLGPPQTVGGDTIPARHATLLALEQASGTPAVGHSEQRFDLFDDAMSTGGSFEEAGVFGNRIADLLTMEGDYTFHFRALYGGSCRATRELGVVGARRRRHRPVAQGGRHAGGRLRPGRLEGRDVHDHPQDKHGTSSAPGGRVTSTSAAGRAPSSPVPRPTTATAPTRFPVPGIPRRERRRPS